MVYVVDPEPVKVIVILKFFHLVDEKVNNFFIVSSVLKVYEIIRCLAVEVCKMRNVLPVEFVMFEHRISAALAHGVVNRNACGAPCTARSRPELFCD